MRNADSLQWKGNRCLLLDLDAEAPLGAAVLNKLTLVGVEREEAIEMMAYVLAVEIQLTFLHDRAFDAASYERMLRELPQLPEMPDTAV